MTPGLADDVVVDANRLDAIAIVALGTPSLNMLVTLVER